MLARTLIEARAPINRAARSKSCALICRLAPCLEAVEAPIAALAAFPTCSHEIEFSFLNGILMVPTGHLSTFNRDAGGSDF
jgi:hypothetical protein